MSLLIVSMLFCFLATSLALTPVEMIKANGYPIEEHTVTTDDGYILTLHRIPYGKKSPAGSKKPPVYLQHGLLSNSADFVVMGTENGLGYLLADAGYDVWLGNCRGNTWSRGHKYLSTSSSKYWQFSWHEMGKYDLPAAIDYILSQTDQEKLFYMGHSMGTTMFYVMGAERPEYNDKIRAMFSLAPIAHMDHTKTPFLKLIAGVAAGLGDFAKLLGINELLPHSDLYPLIGKAAREEKAITKEICSNLIFLIAGYDSQEMNISALPQIMLNDPAGSATRNLLHYAQVIKNGKFAQWSYGALKNMIKYGSFQPPQYDLSKITAPVALMYGQNDLLGDPQDVAKLNEELPNVISYYKVPLDQFNHVDFLWAIHVKTLLYDEILKIMTKY